MRWPNSAEQEISALTENMRPMPDLLVPLYKLPSRGGGAASVSDAGIVLRRPNSFERTPVTEFVRTHFTQGWADEMETTLSRQPVTSFIAIDGKKIVGFAAYEATCKAYFGPTGVDPAYRGRGIGKALLIEALWGLRDLGYAYGIIGAAGPVAFYQSAVGAVVIEGSVPGIYANLLR